MDLYFVRHGETAFNRAHIHQPDDTPLTKLGREQASVVAPLLQKHRPTHLLSSTLTRAVQTATIINKTIGVPHEQWETLGELRRPAYIVGYKHFGLRSLWYMIRWFYDRHDVYSTRTQGESRLAFLERIHEAKLALEQLPKNARVVVVSHSVFINFFVAHICNDEPVPIWQAVLILLKIKRLDNSSITHITFDPDAPAQSCRWNLIAFDNDSHVVT